MNVMKFFRKYNKHLLAGFMALLLVAWLAGDALPRLLSPDENAKVFAKAFGKDLRIRDMAPTYTEAQILNELNIRWQMSWAFSLQDLGVNPYLARLDREPITEQEWYMLVGWAKREGVEVPPAEVQAIKKQLPNAAQIIEIVNKRHGVPIEVIDQAIENFLRVKDAVRQAGWAVLVTEPEVRQRMREVGEKVKVKYLPFGAVSFIDAKAPVSDAELQAQFYKYKDVSPDETTPYGYRLPATVQIEYVTANIAEVAQLIQVDEQKAYSYWKEHKNEFMKPIVDAEATSQPASAPSTQPFDTFEEAKKEVFAKMSKNEAEGEVIRLMRDLISRLSQDWQNAQTGDDRYMIAPDVVKADNYLSREVDVIAKRKYGKALKYNRTAPMTQMALLGDPMIGRASTMDQRRPVMLSTLAFQVQGLSPRPEGGEGDNYLSLYQPFAMPLRDAQDNICMFRVIAVNPSRPPADLKDVRDAVERDVREVRAYQVAGEAARKYAAAAQSGLDDALSADQELRQKLGTGTRAQEATFARNRMPNMFEGQELKPSIVPLIGPDAGFIREAFRLGEMKTSTQPQRVSVVELASSKRWAVIQWIESLPIRQDEYDQQRMQIISSLYTDEAASFVKNFYAPDQIRARAAWKDMEPAQEKEQKPANATTTQKAA